MEEKPIRIIYGTNIEHQENHFDIHDNTFHGGTFNVTDVGKKESEEGDSCSHDPLTASFLEPYIKGGLVGSDLKPVKGLKRGEIAMLEYDIATRAKMKKFWSYFQKRWCNTCNSSDLSKFRKSPESVEFMKRLNNL